MKKVDTSSTKATAYDFVHPVHKMSTQWPVFDLICTKVASQLGAVLSDKLQVSIQGQSTQISRVKYLQSLEAIGATGVVHELSLSPLPGSVWFSMDISVIAAIVNSYFGGNTQLTSVEEPRSLTRTELRVMDHVMDSVMLALANGWEMLIALEAKKLRQIDVKRLLNSVREQVMVSNEISLLIGDIELPCQLVYPFETLKPLSDKLQHEPEKQSSQDAQFAEALKRELLNCELDINGVLAESKITLGKLLDLKTGDFIALRDVQTVSFKTQNMPLFDARIGRSNGRVSASLSRWHLPVAS